MPYLILPGDRLMVPGWVDPLWVVDSIDVDHARPGESVVRLLNGGETRLRRWWWLQENATPAS